MLPAQDGAPARGAVWSVKSVVPASRRIWPSPSRNRIRQGARGKGLCCTNFKAKELVLLFQGVNMAS